MEEIKKELVKKKSSLWFKLYIIGIWVLCGIAIFYAFTVYDQLDLLRTNPCEACVNLTGQWCGNLGVNNYVTNPVIKKNPMDSLNITLEGLNLSRGRK